MSANNRLAEIKARAAAATPGPWRPLVDLCGCPDPCDCGGEFIVGISLPREEPLAGSDFGQISEIGEASEEDQQFLIHSRADVDWLTAEVERLRADRDRYRRWLGEALKERDAAQAEMFQIALDTSPAYAQLRDERDSARRERDEAMAKLDLRGTADTEPRPQAGDRVRGIDLDGVVRVGKLVGFFAWSHEEQKNTRAHVDLADGTQTVVHTASLVVLKAGAQ